MGTRGSIYLVQNEEGHFLGKRNLTILLQWRFFPPNMENSSKALSGDEPPIYTKDDLLHDVLPSNTIHIKNGNISNLHREVMDLIEDIWDEDSEGDPCGVLCSCCNQIAYPNVEMIVLEDIRYFLIFEENLPTVKCNDNELEGFLQCVYCFNFYHCFGCTLSMSTKSYVACLLSRNWACPTCVPAFITSPIRTTRKIHQVKSEMNSNFLIKVFKALNKCSNVNPIKSCCNLVANYIVTNSDWTLIYDCG